MLSRELSPLPIEDFLENDDVILEEQYEIEEDDDIEFDEDDDEDVDEDFEDEYEEYEDEFGDEGEPRRGRRSLEWD